MKRLVLIGLSLLLTSCLGRNDALAPMVTIVSPKSGAVKSTENLEFIEGYALDDEGIRAIRVNGSDLLQSDIYTGERGKQLIFFQFRIREIREGVLAATIEVEDTDGRVTVNNYELPIDNTPPSVSVDALQILRENRVRVSGVATDNTQLKEIVIGQRVITFLPTSEKAFSLDLDLEPGASVTITVRDQAGNEVSRRVTR